MPAADPAHVPPADLDLRPAGGSSAPSAPGAPGADPAAAGAQGSAPGRLVVAVDGPSGSGKSTVARAVARALGWRYVDTGATYRAATLAVLRAGTDPDDRAAVAALVTALVNRGGLVLATDPAQPRVLLDGDDVSAEIRSAPVTSAVSAVSAVPQVRAALLDVQRAAMGRLGAVAEGRDVATAVAPSAAVKVYLDADASVRAQRRAAEKDAGVAAGGQGLVAAVAADLARRDAYDSSRAASPLTASAEAVHLDATALSVDDVVSCVLRLADDAGLTRS